MTHSAADESKKIPLSTLNEGEFDIFLHKMNISAVIPIGRSMRLPQSELKNANHQRFWSTWHTQSYSSSFKLHCLSCLLFVRDFVFLIGHWYTQEDVRGSTRKQVQTTGLQGSESAEEHRPCGVPLSSCECFDRMLAERAFGPDTADHRLRPGASTRAKTICSCQCRA